MSLAWLTCPLERRVEREWSLVLKHLLPQNQSEVESFLGSVQFCVKITPNIATISSPLWVLTCKASEWRWGPREHRAFVGVKTWLTHSPAMAYHRQGAPTHLTTDASPVGTGVILEQEQEDSKLTKVEKRYSQFSRKALAARCACEKSCLYL